MIMPSKTLSAEWYCIYTKPNAEYQLVTAFNRHHIETFLPTVTLKKAEKSRKRTPLFANYLFAKIDFQVIPFTLMRHLPGLRQILPTDEQPAAIPVELVDLIRQKVNECESTNVVTSQRFVTGEKVRITAGPLRELLAVFDRDLAPDKRVQILLDVMGQITRAQINPTHLEKVPVITESPMSKRARRTRGKGRKLVRKPDLRPSGFT